MCIRDSYIHHATRPAELKPLTRAIRERMPEVVGVAVFATGGADEDADDASLESTRLLTRAGKPFIDGADALPDVYKRQTVARPRCCACGGR